MKKEHVFLFIGCFIGSISMFGTMWVRSSFSDEEKTDQTCVDEFSSASNSVPGSAIVEFQTEFLRVSAFGPYGTTFVPDSVEATARFGTVTLQL